MLTGKEMVHPVLTWHFVTKLTSYPTLFGIVQTLSPKWIAPTVNMQPKSDDATLLPTYTHDRK